MKTKKLKCIVTGRILTATTEYYKKKLDKAGTEEELHRSYICKEARDLLSQGYAVEQVRQQFKVTEELPAVPEDVLLALTTNEYGAKRNTMFTELTSFTHQSTDSDVRCLLLQVMAPLSSALMQTQAISTIHSD